MKKSYRTEYYYVCFNDKEQLFIRKFLSKVEDLTNIAQNTLSKHFSVSKSPYKNEIWTIYKTSNIDFKSFNKGNKYNLIIPQRS